MFPYIQPAIMERGIEGRAKKEEGGGKRRRTRRIEDGSSKPMRHIAGSYYSSAAVYQKGRAYQDLSLPTNTSASISTATDTIYQSRYKRRSSEEGKKEEGREEEGRRGKERERNPPIPGPSLYLNTPTSKLSSPPPSLSIDFNLNCLSNPIGGKRGVPMCFLFEIWDSVVAIRPGGSRGPRGCLVVFL